MRTGKIRMNFLKRNSCRKLIRNNTPRRIKVTSDTEIVLYEKVKIINYGSEEGKEKAIKLLQESF